MRKGAVRLAILALLFVTGLGAAYLTWDIHTRIRNGLTAEREVDGRLDRMTAAIAGLGAAQQAYVAPGQQRGDALTRASVLVQQIYEDMAALRLHARSNEAAASLLTFGKTMDGLVNLDDRARDHLRLEQELMAADLIYTEARQTLETMNSQIEALKVAEQHFNATERNALFSREASILGGAALIWVLVIIAVIPRRSEAEFERTSNTSIVASEPVEPVAPSRIDLAAASKVCTELSRLSSSSAMAPALARAARVLDASSLIVWLGAGEELFPATAHGYGPRTLARFGPIPRSGDNATAAAWRTGEMSVVDSASGGTGAIVAPLFGSSGCFGVLTAEVRHGRENDEATRAVAAMFAAQLSVVVAPWPAPSETERASTEVEAPSPVSSEQTAASA